MEKFQISYIKEDEKEVLPLMEALEKKGYSFYIDNTSPHEDVILFLFSKKTRIEDVFLEIPFLKKENSHSAFHSLKVMPFYLYHSSLEDPEETLSEDDCLYMELFSGEFKPFGCDLDSQDPLFEFDRILESYSE